MSFRNGRQGGRGKNKGYKGIQRQKTGKKVKKKGHKGMQRQKQKNRNVRKKRTKSWTGMRVSTRLVPLAGLGLFKDTQVLF